MSNVEIYGELQSEKLAIDNRAARQIVKEINDFGVSDRQRWLIINCLALELENVEEMKAITSFIKEFKGSELFVSRIFGSNEEKEE